MAANIQEVVVTRYAKGANNNFETVFHAAHVVDTKSSWALAPKQTDWTCAFNDNCPNLHITW
jgi:hypothetical protein